MRTPEKERGAILLTTLMVMSIMAALAVAMIDDVRFAVKRAVNVQSYAQADWYALAGEDFAKSYLTTAIASVPDAELNTVLQSGQPILFPIEGGVISMTVRDGSQCLSINDASTRKEFRQLLEVLGWDTLTAARLTSIATDWSDADSNQLPDGAEDYTYLGRTPAYRTANAPFASVMEIRALAEMTEKKYQTLRPFICARGSEQSSKVNINTLTPVQAPLLAAMLGGSDHFAIALQLISERPGNGYIDLETLRSNPLLAGEALKDANINGLTFAPEHIWVETDIFYLEAHRTVLLEFERSENGVTRTFRRFNAEARRPILEPEPS